ncbi:transmembrane protein, putative (macronuclear) [Tetrahymena thermophila SB210]|uniref:Transmembrane protein, putative n=1 Tax=Tetrahymena thermophila (strain SB210) TaxID=312017 RepID=I7M6U4_TETTS|nr:transmembrane protein, putative [Tetrahymena thermophila SB210]EAR87272.1 transmembrane protein, putative [Tetrahymena thermophila SB210]|eukprot:XP_001007517.1 transmembrane protein, putative [Tetrahymena thermophila SB210]
MNDLQHPLSSNKSLDQQNAKSTVKDHAKVSMNASYINQIQQNQVQVSDMEKPQGIFQYCFGFSLLFQIVGTIIVLINLILQIFEYDYDSLTLGLQIGFFVFSILSVITYIYLCSEASQWEPLNVFNSIRLSFIFTLISFGIGVAIFNIFTTKSWDCSTNQNCQQQINQQSSSNQTIQSNCQQKLSNSTCYEQRIALLMKYIILICCGVPLILMAISIYKYNQYKKKSKEENEKQHELQNSSVQQVIENNQNFFSNRQKLIYSTDLETSKYAYSSNAMANPQQMSNLSGGSNQKNRVQMSRQVYELNNEQL